MNMRLYLTILLLIAVNITVPAQNNTSLVTSDSSSVAISRASYEKHNTILSFGVGFMDQYKSDYKYPTGFSKGTSSGFAPLYLKVEYGLSQHMGLAVNFMYDGFYETYAQNYDNFGTSYQRYIKDNVRAFQAGLLLYYHFRELIPVKKLDVFIAVGGALNRVAHSNMPHADSTVAKATEHGAAAAARLGVRYFINNKASVFAEGGYDNASIFSIGFSCRFFNRHEQ